MITTGKTSQYKTLYLVQQGPQAVLTWAPGPGDQVIDKMDARFTGSTTITFREQGEHPEGGEYWAETVFGAAFVNRDTTGEDGDFYKIECEQIDGQDAIREQLRAALAGDWRAAKCRYKLVEWTEEIDPPVMAE